MNEKLYQYITIKFSLETEIWDLNNGDSRTVDPTLQGDHYVWGIGIYLVPSGFCSNQ